MPREYVTIVAPAQDDFFEKKSQFIGHIAPVSSEEEALAFLSQVRAQHREARHNCYAFRLENGVKRCSDAGEPQGTAGVPMLEVLEREGLSDVVVVVTRYFGGILLGAGGLVRAYAHAAKLAVDAAQRQVMSPAVTLRLELDYNQYGRVQQLLGRYTHQLLSSDFGSQVSLRLLLLASQEAQLCEELRELTAATAVVTREGQGVGAFLL